MMGELGTESLQRATVTTHAQSLDHFAGNELEISEALQ
jgi:hypothetical protein